MSPAKDRETDEDQRKGARQILPAPRLCISRETPVAACHHAAPAEGHDELDGFELETA